MSDQGLYDEDILLWSEQQAEVIRRLGRTRDLSNELDIENVAEEIESVGRSELAAVQSYIHLIFVHLIKWGAEPDASATRHWQSEIFAFHGEMRRRYAPSMRQRLDLDDLWRSAREQVMLAYEGPQQDVVAALPAHSVFGVDDLLGARIDIPHLMQRLRQAVRPRDGIG